MCWPTYTEQAWRSLFVDRYVQEICNIAATILINVNDSGVQFA